MVEPRVDAYDKLKTFGDAMSFQLLAGRDANQYIGKKPYIFIDLRNHEDYAEGHIQYAQNLPYIYFDQYVNKLPKDRVYILYCSYGSVSMLAARQMEKLGYDVLSISGGISSYRGSLFV